MNKVGYYYKKNVTGKVLNSYKRIIKLTVILGMFSLFMHGCKKAEITNDTTETIEETVVIRVESVRTARNSRQEIEIAWSDCYDEIADSYILKKRARENGQAVGDWCEVAVIESDKSIDDLDWEYIDKLENDQPQQYEYRIDVNVSDSETYTAKAGKSVLGSNIKICIDPGHYHVKREVADADEYHYIEGDVVLEIALKLKEILKETYGIDSCLTRNSDIITLGGYTNEELDSTHISLRGGYAAEMNCDLFVSLHTNSNEEDANGYSTFFQPLSINKPIIIVNSVGLTSKIAMKTANAIGTKLASVNFELGLSETDVFEETDAEQIKEWTQEYNDSLHEIGTVVVRKGKKDPDYYGILRGATDTGMPGMIIEHGYHSVMEVRKAAIIGDLKEVWANADAVGIAYGFGFTK